MTQPQQMTPEQITPEQMTPELSLNFLDSIVSQCKNPALNRHEAMLALQAVQVLRIAIADRVGTDGKVKPPKLAKKPKA